MGMGTLEAVVVGAGNRGRFTYGGYARQHPSRLRIVALAEPDDGRRAAMAAEHGIPDARCYSDFDAMFAEPCLAPLAIVATGDTQHVGPTLRALERGYHVLLEKPIAVSAADCIRVVDAADRAGRILQIGHVLRFTPFYSRIHEILSAGAIGETDEEVTQLILSGLRLIGGAARSPPRSCWPNRATTWICSAGSREGRRSASPRSAASGTSAARPLPRPLRRVAPTVVRWRIAVPTTRFASSPTAR